MFLFHKAIEDAKNSKRIYEIRGILTKKRTYNSYGEIMVGRGSGRMTKMLKFYAYSSGGVDAIRRVKIGSTVRLSGHLKKITDEHGKKHLFFCPIGNVKAWGSLSESIKNLIDKGINPTIDEQKNTYLHHCASNGELNDCNPMLLTKSNLSIQNKLSESAYLAAAEHGEFDKIPPHLIDEEILTRVERHDNTCLHFLAQKGQLGIISTMYVNAENINNLRNWDKETPLHLAAKFNEMPKVPEELITKEGLLKPNRDGHDALYFLAERGELKSLPEKFRTIELFSRETKLNQEGPAAPNTNGTTVFHEAAKHNWSQIDAHLVTKKILMLRNSSGYTVLSQLPNKEKGRCLSLFSKEEIYKMKHRVDLGFNNKESKEFKIKNKFFDALQERKNTIDIDIEY
jgi:ankyrin repeat protein